MSRDGEGNIFAELDGESMATSTVSFYSTEDGYKSNVQYNTEPANAGAYRNYYSTITPGNVSPAHVSPGGTVTVPGQTQHLSASLNSPTGHLTTTPSVLTSIDAHHHQYQANYQAYWANQVRQHQPPVKIILQMHFV